MRKLHPIKRWRAMRREDRILARGTLLVLAAFISAFPLSGFPTMHESLWLTLPLAVSVWGTCEMLRCLRRQWNFYHGGVLLLIYSGIMVAALVIFLLVYPLMTQ